MAAYRFLLCVPVVMLVYDVAGQLPIASFDVTVRNPYVENHDIPLQVYYPNPPEEAEAVSWPTVVFGHGFECPSQYYKWISEFLVPAGYIVVYVNSFATGKLNQTEYSIDQRYTLEWLNTVANTDRQSPLYQIVDTFRSMAAGHSEGGGASLLSAGSEEIASIFAEKYNFSSVFVVAPCGQKLGEASAAAKLISVPVFVFTGTMDCICTTDEPIHFYDVVPSSTCKYLADISNGTHCQWLDVETAFSTACRALEVDTCKGLHPMEHEMIEPKEQLEIGAKYMQLFLKATLGNASDSRQANNEIVSDLSKDQEFGLMKNVGHTTVCDS